MAKQISLSDREEKIMAYINYRGQATVPEIAAELGCKSHTVHYALRRIRENKLILRRPVINVFALGFQRIGIYFCLTSSGRQNKSKLLEFLHKHENVALILEFAGEFDIEINIVVRNTFELSEFLDSICRKFGNIFASKQVVSQQWHTIYGWSRSSRPRPVKELPWYGITRKKVRIDELDHRLLSVLSKDKFGSQADLARQVGESASKVAYRLKRLEDNEVITGYGYMLALEKVGFRYFALQVYTEQTSDALHEKMLKFGLKHPSTGYYVRIMGPWDFEFSLIVDKHSEVDLFLNDLNKAFGSVIRKTAVAACVGAPKVMDYPFRSFKEQV